MTLTLQNATLFYLLLTIYLLLYCVFLFLFDEKVAIFAQNMGNNFIDNAQQKIMFFLFNSVYFSSYT